MTLKKTGIFAAIGALVCALSIIAYITFFRSDVRIVTYNKSYRQQMLDMFQKNWYWLVANPKFSAEIFLDHLAPKRDKPELFGMENIRMLVTKDNKVIGFVSYYKRKFYEGFIHFLAVDEAHRGKRYAEKLLKPAIQDLFSQGVDLIRIDVRDSNEAAIKVYKRLGFKEVNRGDDDMLLMELKK